MNEFINVKTHPRYSFPQNVGDMMVKERLEKYLSQREKLLSYKRYDLRKINEIEAKNLQDDFDFWWYKVDAAFINSLIKLYKSEAKISR
jgi:hypothetical protein